MESLLAWLAAAPPGVLYLALGCAAALENLIPPIPADVAVAFGGLAAGRGAAEPWVAFLVVWSANVAGALLVYALGRRFGRGLFAGRWGRLILRPHQLDRLGDFYRRHGAVVVFISRFLPMFRAVVPVFAGVSRIGIIRTAVPLAAASALWYGGLVYLGAAAGRNWEEIRATLAHGSRWLAGLSVMALAGLLAWWWRSRRDARR